jgi:4a-hydroxytetrahydrobiopterin dehydratase
MTMQDPTSLASRHCQPCKGGTDPLTPEQAQILLQSLVAWTLEADHISKTFRFKNYYETIAFVNALAWVAHQEDHHPDLVVAYRTCTVRYATHSIGGLSENDFICAAKIDALLDA